MAVARRESARPRTFLNIPLAFQKVSTDPHRYYSLTQLIGDLLVLYPFAALSGGLWGARTDNSSEPAKFPLDWRDAIQLKMRHHALRLLGTEITDLWDRRYRAAGEDTRLPGVIFESPLPHKNYKTLRILPDSGGFHFQGAGVSRILHGLVFERGMDASGECCGSRMDQGDVWRSACEVHLFRPSGRKSISDSPDCRT